MLDSNYFILNRHPQKFSEMRIAGKVLVFTGEDGRPLDFGVVQTGTNIYTVLECDEVRNITMVTDKDGHQDVITILWAAEDDYQRDKARLAGAMKRRFYVQTKKLNRYAESIAEKLAIGVRLRVTDAVDESKMAVCPECGMLNPPGSMYCLDCGAEIS
ncbi:MAG: zinc ribbon domain-containing protein [Mogibacterium sp.]|nr:zinc ribbon domain-containing protein [Mogibacterium sp.]